MAYALYPPIGIARVGDSPEQFFIGPEIPGRPGTEIDANGQEQPVTQYKAADDSGSLLIKRQAARFHLFEIPDDGSAPRPAVLPEGAKIEYRVHLINKKAAVVRPNSPRQTPSRPVNAPNPANLLIDPGSRTITGANASGVFFNGGRYRGREVPLGELRTDSQQRLLVLGGHGFSSSPTNAQITNFYNNSGWHDDTSDGSVEARVVGADGAVLLDYGQIAPAWVIATTPDYAPEIGGFVTLYDVLYQVAISSLGVVPPVRPSFTNHIYPILSRINRLQWVNVNDVWTDLSTDWATLSNSAAGSQAARTQAARDVNDAATFLSSFRLTDTQTRFINQWAAGDFDADWNGVPQPSNAISADGLTRAALDGTVGQGFFPGIEAGIIVRDPTLYSSPFDFRIDLGSVTPGTLTALMALPWQADFWDCAGAWWPAQRPDDVRTSPNSTATQMWARGIDSYVEMVRKFGRLGFVVPKVNANGQVVFVEDQRAPDSVFL